MSFYTGKTGNIAFLPSNPIVSSTNTSPIVLQLTNPVTQAQVDTTRAEISGHTVNTNANGIFKLAFVDAFHVSLVGSIGNGVGGNTGTLVSLSLGTATVVDDSSIPNAAQFRTETDFSLDALAFVSEGIGTYKIVQANASARANDPPFSAWNTFSIAAQNTWTASAGPTIFTLAGTQFGDIVTVDFEFSAQVLVNTGGGGVQSYAAHSLFVSDVLPGQPDSYARIIGSSRLFNSSPAPASGVQPTTPLHINGTYFVQGGGNTLKFQLQALYNNAVLPSAWVVLGEWSMAFKIFRATGMPQ